MAVVVKQDIVDIPDAGGGRLPGDFVFLLHLVGVGQARPHQPADLGQTHVDEITPGLVFAEGERIGGGDRRGPLFSQAAGLTQFVGSGDRLLGPGSFCFDCLQQLLQLGFLGADPFEKGPPLFAPLDPGSPALGGWGEGGAVFETAFGIGHMHPAGQFVRFAHQPEGGGGVSLIGMDRFVPPLPQHVQLAEDDRGDHVTKRRVFEQVDEVGAQQRGKPQRMMQRADGLFAEHAQLGDGADGVGMRVRLGEAPQLGQFGPVWFEELEVDRLHRQVVAGNSHERSQERMVCQFHQMDVE